MLKNNAVCTFTAIQISKTLRYGLHSTFNYQDLKSVFQNVFEYKTIFKLNNSIDFIISVIKM